MPRKIYRCLKCGRYTLHTDKCPVCGGPVAPAHPPRFSPEDKYGKYRRVIKYKLTQIKGEDNAKEIIG